MTDAKIEPVAWLSMDSVGDRFLCFTKPLGDDQAQPLVPASALEAALAELTKTRDTCGAYMLDNDRLQRLLAAEQAKVRELVEVLEGVWLWMENQADGQSKGGHETFDLMMLREQRDIASAAITKHGGSV